MAAAADEPGIKIGRTFKVDVELLYTIGHGAYGAVWVGLHKPSNKLLAVKSRRASRTKEVEEIRRETKLLKECSSPSIVRFFGSAMERSSRAGGAQEAVVWICMEFCEAGSVRSVLKSRERSMGSSGPGGGLSAAEVACITADVLLGLQYIHSRKMIHRDVKSDNILLSRDGRAKLADFGISSTVRGTMDRKRTMIGTPHFLAPEVVTVEDLDIGYDHRCDIWSLGITCIEMAERDPPRFGQPPMRILFAVPREEPPRLKEPEKWSSHFADFLHGCLRLDPDDRLSVSQLLEHEFISEYDHDREQVMQGLVDAHLRFRAGATTSERKRQVFLGNDCRQSELAEPEKMSDDEETVPASPALARRKRASVFDMCRERRDPATIRQRSFDVSKLLSAAEKLDGEDPAAAAAVRELLELGHTVGLQEENPESGNARASTNGAQPLLSMEDFSRSPRRRHNCAKKLVSPETFEGDELAGSQPSLSPTEDLSRSPRRRRDAAKKLVSSETTNTGEPAAQQVSLATKMEQYARKLLHRGLAFDIESNVPDALICYQKACDVLLELLKNPSHSLSQRKRSKLRKILLTSLDRTQQLELAAAEPGAGVT